MTTSRVIAVVGLLLGSLADPCVAAATTYYVGTGGDDTRTPTQAQNPATPWRTIRNALTSAVSGDTINVNPGIYNESVESRRDGFAGAPITLEASAPGQVTITPPAGSPGFYISHNYHAIIGFIVTGASIGIRLGGHDGGGPVIGIRVQGNTVSHNSSNGIQATSTQRTEISFNQVFENGQNGISYSGDASSIHDNVVHHNGQFGIYVKDGVDHVVYDNTAFSNAQADLQIVGTTSPSPPGTYYVDCQTGNDARTATEAKNPGTPWRTVKQALGIADGGDTVMVVGGTVTSPRLCNEGTIESKRAGRPGTLITIKAATPGAVIVDPLSGNGFFIKHAFHAIDGFIIKGATNGVHVQASDVEVRQNDISFNGLAGVKVSGATSVAIVHNVIHDNAGEGVVYETGTHANVFNNLVYSNGAGGAWGIEISEGNGHRVTNNTVWGHNALGGGGIRLGVSIVTPVYSTVVNNIVVNNRVGIKEPGADTYAGIAKLEFNNVFGNGTNYDLSESIVGISSLSQDPHFVSVTPGDARFLRLSQAASGQPVDSPTIDKGSTTADALGLASRSVFTSNAPDTGRVDFGYHWP